ncbi:MAG: hypothetical protein J3K34DRAFT_401042 [Monoraphidium minutum]|nr:MAG: hypothetical protein J3K34DRAFT_401042 [Monoraphidium minutum]
MCSTCAIRAAQLTCYSVLPWPFLLCGFFPAQVCPWSSAPPATNTSVSCAPCSCNKLPPPGPMRGHISLLCPAPVLGQPLHKGSNCSKAPETL